MWKIIIGVIMAIKSLDHNLSYEWVGSFWFPDTKESKLSGKISYTPEKGIKLHLTTNDADESHLSAFQAKRMMHAVVYTEGKLVDLTLINVVLSSNFTNGDTIYAVLEGWVQLLAFEVLLEDELCKKMAFEYDNYFENCLLLPTRRVRDALKLSKNSSFTVSENNTVGMYLFSSGAIIYSVDDFDAVFFSSDEEKFSTFKKNSKSIVEDGSYFLTKRDKNNFVTVIENKKGKFDSIQETERLWRQFWEFLADNAIGLKHAWLYTSSKSIPDKETCISRNVALYSYNRSKESRNVARILQLLPININSFSQYGSDLDAVKPTIKKWFEISQDKKFEPVMQGVRKILRSQYEIVDTSQYISLISDIETFLDIKGEKKTDVDCLVEKYASEKWKEEFLQVAYNKPEKETIGCWAHKIRNAIVHPKTCQKIASGKYWEAASNPFILQKVYAYISGLYAKALLIYLGGINVDHIEKYTDSFIKARSSYSPIEYD